MTELSINGIVDSDGNFSLSSGVTGEGTHPFKLNLTVTYQGDLPTWIDVTTHQSQDIVECNSLTGEIRCRPRGTDAANQLFWRNPDDNRIYADVTDIYGDIMSALSQT